MKEEIKEFLAYLDRIQMHQQGMSHDNEIEWNTVETIKERFKEIFDVAE